MFKKAQPKPAFSYPIARPYRSPSGDRRRRPIPDNIKRLYIPLTVLEATDRIMRRFGREKRECYVWWGGSFTWDGEGQVLTALCPEMHSEYGRIHLQTHNLTVMHSHLREIDQILLAELHTHPPGAGGQNDVDAAYPAATYRGFISIVVPDFASPIFHDLRNVYVYEYLGSGGWQQLKRAEIEDRFVIEESFFSVKV